MSGRIRTIKPEAFLDEDLWDLEVSTGLPIFRAYVGLWCQADREGRFEWRPRKLRAEILPYWEQDFGLVLDALLESDFVASYEVEGKRYGFIPTFLKHQVINIREAKSKLPAPPAHVQTHAEYAGTKVLPEVREIVFARDGRKCLRCDRTDDLTLDHILPQCLGGTHDVKNLRTLCRSCNSARPVAGQALIDDLARDGHTVESLQRMCNPVQAQGEGKGRERKGKEEEGSDAQTSKSSVPEGERFAMYPSWQPNEPTLASLETSQIPRWAAAQIAGSFRTHFVNSKGIRRTDAEWNQTFSRWVAKDWNDKTKRPIKPDEDDPAERARRHAKAKAEHDEAIRLERERVQVQLSTANVTEEQQAAARKALVGVQALARHERRTCT